MIVHRGPNTLLLATSLIVLLAGVVASAQRGIAAVERRSRLEILTDAFALDNDQKKQVKTVLDAAYKDAASIRSELAKARTALAAAIQENKPQADIDAATQHYAVQVAAMTEAEMRALAQVLSPLSKEQKSQGTVTAFYLMRTIFLDDDEWDEVPEIRMY